jgi:hypothetical protein
MKETKLLLAMLLLWGIGKATAPILLLPTNAIDTQAVKLKFVFHPVAAMQYYDVQVDTTPLFNSVLLKDSIGSIDYSSLNTSDSIIKTIYSLYYGNTQYWRVRGRNSTDTTDWSEVRSFNCRNFPFILNPTNNYFFPTLTGAATLWKNIGGSTYYQVQVGSTSVFISPIYIYNTTSITRNYPHWNNISVGFSGMPVSTNYYLRIKAYNEVDSSDWSPEVHFNIIDQTSVSESEAKSFTLFPNPANQIVHITSKANLPIVVFNSLGEIVYESILPSINSQIDLSNLAAGNYFIQIIDSDKLLVQRLVITQ